MQEAEDDLDERMFQKYREQRMGELLEKQQKERFGEVVHVKQDEYVKEITEASQGETVVFVHLYQDSIPECKRLNMVSLGFSVCVLRVCTRAMTVEQCGPSNSGTVCSQLLL